MAEQLSIFRIQIDGEWTATEMSREIEAINYIHNMFFLGSALYGASSVKSSEFQVYSPKDSIVAELGTIRQNHWTSWSPFRLYVSESSEREDAEQRNNTELDLLVKELSDTRLSVSQIRYGSPGFQDFFGIAKVVREVLAFINGLIKIGIEFRMAKLDLENKQQEIEARKQMVLKLKLDNLTSFLKTLRDNGIGDREIERVLRNIDPYQMMLIHLASENKITSALSSEIDKAA
jgi:hypothetical protein